MPIGSDVILERLMSLHPKVIDLSLDRMWWILEALGNPQDHLAPVIHVAGTNGKGSTLAMIRAGLEASGARVQAYSSPHLVRFHERVRLVDGLIAEDHLAAVLEECEAANGGAPITYFEITTAAALLAFSRQEADFCLLEVGLGGRLDATNVIARPKLTAITPVSIDHQQFLGDTLEQIAFEKAGIMKRDVPCVVSRQADDARDVIEARAAFARAPLVLEGQDWTIHEEHGRLAFQDMSGLMDLPMPSLWGAHQVDNAGTALACLRALGMPDAACEAAVTQAQWPARMQRLKSGALAQRAPGAELWLDGGHNAAAGAALGAALRRMPLRPTYAICGMLNTKDPSGFLAPFAGQVEEMVAVSIPGAEATLDAAQTAEAARQVGLSASEAVSVEAALDAIVAKDALARVLICGSLYLAGHVLAQIP